MVDNGSAVDLLYHGTYTKMGLKDSNLKPVTTPLYGFTSDFVLPCGRINLPLTVEEFPRTSTIMIEFLVVDYPFTFNAVLGRPSIKALKVVTSIYNLAMKFQISKGIGILKGSLWDMRKC